MPDTNVHPMATRSKAVIFKPKVMAVEVVEPSTLRRHLLAQSGRLQLRLSMMR